VRAQRQDTLSRGDFAKWIVKHIDSWFAFAQRLGFGIEQMEEIVLVTGCDRTKSWTNVAFLGCQAEAQVSFAFRVAEGPGDSIEWQVSPGQIGGAVLAQGPSGQVWKFVIASINDSETAWRDLVSYRTYPRISAYLSEVFVPPAPLRFSRSISKQQPKGLMATRMVGRPILRLARSYQYLLLQR
jgi:hypothetical protein